jgi:hypothetical protein
MVGQSTNRKLRVRYDDRNGGPVRGAHSIVAQHAGWLRTRFVLDRIVPQRALDLPPVFLGEGTSRSGSCGRGHLSRDVVAARGVRFRIRLGLASFTEKIEVLNGWSAIRTLRIQFREAPYCWPT